MVGISKFGFAPVWGKLSLPLLPDSGHAAWQIQITRKVEVLGRQS